MAIRTRWVCAVLATLAIATLAPSAHALVIQRTGDNFVAWEAEDFDTNVAYGTSAWSVQADALASGGVALRSPGNASNPPGNGLATYGIQFADDGLYRLYFRMYSPNNGADSMFRSPDFDQTPDDPPGRHLPIYTSYTWYNDGGLPTRYQVDAGDIGSTLDLTVGSREGTFRVDRFVLSKSTGLSGTQLDLLLNSNVAFTHAIADGAWATGTNWDNGTPSATNAGFIGAGHTIGLASAGQQTPSLVIGHDGSTLPGDGTLNQTGGDLTVTQSLHIGVNDNGTGHVTGSYTASGGTLTVGTPGGVRGNLFVGRATTSGSYNATGTLDLSGATQFDAHLSRFEIGNRTTSSSSASYATGTVTLAQTNNIDATTILISENHMYTVPPQAKLLLGQTNNISTDTMTVAGYRGNALVDWAPGVTGGVLNLTGSSGAEADLRVGYCWSGTGTATTGTFDVTGGTFNATLDDLIVAYRIHRGEYDVTTNATMSFDAGDVDANDVIVGWGTPHPSDGTIGKGIGTLNMGGGTFDVANNMELGKGTSGSSGTFHMTGGTTTVAGNVLGGPGSSTLNIDDGTLNVAGDLTVDSLRVGYNTGNALVTVDGVATIGDGTGTLNIGRCDIATTTRTTGELDLSNADSVTIDVNEIRLGYEANSGTNTNVGGILRLSQTGPNAVSAQTMIVGDTVNNFNYQTVDHIVELGGGANTFNVDTLTIGRWKADGYVTIAPGGTFDLTGLTSSGDKTNLGIGDCNTGTGAQVASFVNLTGGTFNATLGQLTIGRYGSGSGYSRGTLVMDAGTVTADSVDLAWVTGSASTPWNTRGTLEMNGGSLVVAGNMDEGSGDGGGLSTMLIDNGTLTIGGNLVVDALRVGYDTGNATVTVNGPTVSIGGSGSLDIGRRDVHSDTNNTGTLDLGSTSSVTIGVDNLRLGIVTIGTGLGRAQGTLTLSQAGTNTISANSIMMGDTEWIDLNSVMSRIHLGNTNTIHTDLWTIGGRKGFGTVDMVAGGTLTLDGLSGARADLRLGYNNTSTGTAANGTLNLSGGTFVADLDEVAIGHKSVSGGGSATAVLLLGDSALNDVDANSVVLGHKSGSGSGGSTGTLTMGGGTFAVSGNVTDGGGTSTVNVDGGTMTIGGDLIVDHLRVGYNMRNGKVTAGGTVRIGASGDLDVGVRDVGSDTKTTGELDFSAADSVWFDVDRLRIGVIASTQLYGEAQGIVTLSQAGSNTIHADSIVIGDTAMAYNFQAVDHALHLGGADNTIRTDTLTVGGAKADATLDIVPGGTLDLAGSAGAKTNLFIGDCNVGTGATVSSTMDMSNATLNATLGQVVIGRYGSGPGYSRGTLIIDGGTVTADSILLADVTNPGGTTTPANTHGTVTLRGGSLTVGSVTKGEGQAFFNFSGGTLQIGTFGFTLEQNGGTLAPGTSPGYARIDGDYLLNDGILEIEANDAADQGDLLPQPPPNDNNIGYDHLEVTGTAMLDGVLEFALLGSYAPALGTYFDVVSASEIIIGENFALDQSGAGLPAGGNDFAWSIVREGNREFLRLGVVPEPTTFALIALGIAPLLRRRRRA